ncbi:hypothetical protein H7X46_11525 [Pseudonocardia sp. C8]|uniref:hypothetical protein n=1 Tax=Pseudonocardia sp. C8 TaxID=2762759 RepID=UPI0016429A6F|nr:hypothetical protein [Pseudonocardia sp. C8]MBC3191691.1 hypothetical protein [Pseudonocardia sp. C8]
MKNPNDHGRFATAAELANLAAELNQCTRRVDEAAGQVAELARRFAGLSTTVAGLLARPGELPPPSWLMAPMDREWVADCLDELGGWMRAVYLRYTDAAQSLPDCWCFHADVVEELLWLMHAWANAYQGGRASVQLVGDWHERLRPGVVRRIRTYAGTCSSEAHLVREGWRQVATGAPTLPAECDLGAVAAWWAGDRAHSAPEPTAARAGGMGDVLDGRGEVR